MEFPCFDKPVSERFENHETFSLTLSRYPITDYIIQFHVKIENIEEKTSIAKVKIYSEVHEASKTL